MITATGYCGKSGQFYRLLINPENHAVTDFYLCENQQQPVPDEKAGLRAEIVTDDSLRACPGCGQRAVSGCTCPEKSLPCERNVGFRFYCIYCSRMKVISVDKT